MSSSSSSISTAGSYNVRCKYGIPARMRKAWTDDNPGRRFYGCSHWKLGGGGCGFFEWHDLPIEGRARAVIISLLQKKRELQRKVREIEEKLSELEKVGQKQTTNCVGYCSIL